MNELEVVSRHDDTLPVATEDPTRDRYAGITTLTLTPEQEQQLSQPIPPEDLDIKPDGSVYASQVRYRRILNDVFGRGKWALLPRGDWGKQENTLCREYALIVEGRYISEAVGEQDYIPNNPNMTWATATEGVKSNALMRCCKDLGIASECWDRRFTEAFKAEHCVQAWVEQRDKSVKPQWRRKDARPFFKEKGLVQHSEDGSEGVPPPQRRSETAAGVISEPQRKRMYAIQKNAGHSDESVREWLKSVHGIEHSNDVPRNKYDAICARLEDKTPLADRVPGAEG